MPASLCCPQCGTPSAQASSRSTTAMLCPACSSGLPAETATPWWVESAPTVLPPPKLPPPLPAHRLPRLRTRHVAAAAIVLMLAGLIANAWPRRSSKETLLPQASSLEGKKLAEMILDRLPAVENARIDITPSPVPPPVAPPVPKGKQPVEPARDRIVSFMPPPLPPPAKAVQAVPANPAPRRGLHQLDLADEEELLRQAATAPEVGLGSSGVAVINSYLTHIPANQVSLATANLTEGTPLLSVRPDLRMLPIRFGERCKLDGKQTVALDRLARKLHEYLDTFLPETLEGRNGPTEKLRQTLLSEMHDKKPEWLRPEAVRALVQILMGEDTPIRKILVELLAKIDAMESTIALAQRAVFDLSPEVREAAVSALKGRPVAVYRPVFLKALRYPWAVPAQHAAEALVELRDTGSVPLLVCLLNLPDPAGPLTVHNNRRILQDVVRLNHIHNCLVCHAPAASSSDLVLGVDPFVPLPARLQTSSMSAASQRLAGGFTDGASSYRAGGRGGGQQTVLLPLLIRADITFMRQDFSVRQPVRFVRVPFWGPIGSRHQRFDYVLRTRLLPRKVYSRLEEMAGEGSSYPQREAVLFALRELSGKDVGPTTEAWMQLFPSAQQALQAVRLGRQIVQSSGLDHEAVLAKCRVGDGPLYTQALANAIPYLKGATKERVRAILTDRLMRMPMNSLRDHLRDNDPEIRRAALLCCGRRDKKQVVPELLALLDDPEPITARMAEEGLAAITGEHLKDPAEWRAWWKKHGEEPRP
jgi:hypothetical protein